MAITKAQLQAEVEALRHNNELLRTQLESAQAERDELREWHKSSLEVINELKAELAMLKAPAQRVVRHQPAKKIFEFDPNIKGDFARACKLAKEFGGICRRMQAH